MTETNSLMSQEAESRNLRARMVAASAELWSGETPPDWSDNEYMRGQVELIAETTGYTEDSDVEKDAIYAAIVKAMAI